MNYQCFKMSFPNGVHFGSKFSDESQFTLLADTLFSALCIEANKLNRLEELLSNVNNGDVMFSDAMPFIENDYFIPKPLVKVKTEKSGDSKTKKSFKKLQYISFTNLNSFINGTIDAEEENEKFSKLGISSIRTVVSVTGQKDPQPYRIGVYNFNINSGLYIIVGYSKDENLDFITELLENLSYSGIGGKRTAGIGRFQLKYGKLPENFISRINRLSDVNITLSVSLPREDEMEIINDDSRVKLIKRSGFVFSESYANEFLRKHDIYLCNAGSVFKSHFVGDVYDVSCGGNHSVYRYAKPMFLGVDAV